MLPRHLISNPRLTGPGKGKRTRPASTLASDPVPDPYTTFLMLGQGANTSTTFTDIALGGSGNPHTLTAQGGAQVTTAVNDPFGNNVGVMRAQRSTADRVSASASGDFDPVGQNFVVECWGYHTGFSGVLDYFLMSNLLDGWRLGAQYTGASQKCVGSVRPPSAFSMFDTSTFPTNQWVHVALVRTNSNVYYLFCDGTQVATNTQAGDVRVGASLDIGSSQANPAFNWDGYISNCRISIGTDRGYTGATITVPTEAFSAYL
jgi:hypothetical protein